MRTSWKPSTVARSVSFAMMTLALSERFPVESRRELAAFPVEKFRFETALDGTGGGEDGAAVARFDISIARLTMELMRRMSRYETRKTSGWMLMSMLVT